MWMKNLFVEKRNALFVVRNKVEQEQIAHSMEVGPARGEEIATFYPRQRVMEVSDRDAAGMPTSMPSRNQTDVAEPAAEPGAAAELPSTPHNWNKRSTPAAIKKF